MPRKLALVIGNSTYDDQGLARLTAPGADVRALAGVLIDPTVGGFDEVTPLLDCELRTVRKGIVNFFDRKSRDDLLLLYFSGHGVRDDQGRLYLAVKDTESSLLSATALEAAFITERMDHSASKRLVLVLDCCHSGAFGRGAKAVAQSSVGTEDAFRGSGRGRVVLTATDSTQYAWEGDTVIGHAEGSVFTHFMTEGLRTGAADLDKDGQVTVDELYDYVYEQVVGSTSTQTPGKWVFGQQGEIVLAAVPATPPSPGEVAAALERSRRPPWLARLARLVTPLVAIALATIVAAGVLMLSERRARLPSAVAPEHPSTMTAPSTKPLDVSARPEAPGPSPPAPEVHSTEPPPASATTASGTVARVPDLDQQIDRQNRYARSEMSAGRLENALGSLRRAMKLSEHDGRVTSLALDLADEAGANAVNARQSASDLGELATALPAFRIGDSKLADAERLVKAGRSAGAIAAFLAASDAFDSAATAFRRAGAMSAQTTTAAAAKAPAAPAVPPPNDAASRPSAAAPTTASGAKPRESPDAAINRLLEAYQQARSSGSIGALRAVWPTMSKDQEERLRSAGRSVESEKHLLEDCTTPAIDGNGATVSCTEQIDSVVAGGLRQHQTTHTIFSLRHDNDRWTIVEIRRR